MKNHALFNIGISLVLMSIIFSVVGSFAAATAYKVQSSGKVYSWLTVKGEMNLNKISYDGTTYGGVTGLVGIAPTYSADSGYEWVNKDNVTLYGEDPMNPGRYYTGAQNASARFRITDSSTDYLDITLWIEGTQVGTIVNDDIEITKKAGTTFGAWWVSSSSSTW